MTTNIKNLFEFIDFLHSQKSYLLSKQNLIDETNELLRKRNSIKPRENYKSKIEYDKIEFQIAEKFDIVENEILSLLKNKITELDIADISTPAIHLTAHSDLLELQRNFDEDDLKLIFEAKKKYLNFRTETNFDYYLQFFFFELDRTLKEFYDFFDDTDGNELENLIKKTIKVDTWDELAELISTGKIMRADQTTQNKISTLQQNQIDINLLKYLSENFTSTDKRFNDLTKYNQIYRFLNEGRDYNIEHRAYKNLIKELFNFDYGNREIKGQTQKHLTQLENLETNYSNSKK